MEDQRHEVSIGVFKTVRFGWKQQDRAIGGEDDSSVVLNKTVSDYDLAWNVRRSVRINSSAVSLAQGLGWGTSKLRKLQEQARTGSRKM